MASDDIAFMFLDSVCDSFKLFPSSSLLATASYSGFPMDSMKSSYSSGYSSSYGGGYGSGYGSGLASGGGSYSGGSSGGYSTTQSKKNVVIKMIETKDGRVVSESSEVIED